MAEKQKKTVYGPTDGLADEQRDGLRDGRADERTDIFVSQMNYDIDID